MGVDNLSVGVADIPRIKWLVRSFTKGALRELTDFGLTQEHAMDIRKLVEKKGFLVNCSRFHTQSRKRVMQQYRLPSHYRLQDYST